MPAPDAHTQDDQTGSTPAEIMPSTVEPPVLPPPLPAPARRGWSPWVIVALCVAGLMAFLALGTLTLGFVAVAKHRAERAQRTARAGAAGDIRPGPAQGAAAGVVRVSNAEGGLSYTNVQRPEVPWSIHVLKVDRSHKDLAFHAAHARGTVLGVSLIAEQARAVPSAMGRAVAGVNGDFYVRDHPTYAGDPRGLQILQGELISAPDTWSVWFDQDGNPHLGEVKADFQVTWPDGRKTRFGLNEQRRPRMAVLYTPTYGASTRTSGGREWVLEQDVTGPWLPLCAGQTYRARVREIRPGGNSPLAANTLVLSLAPDLLSSLPETGPGAVLLISIATTPDLAGATSAIGGGPALIREGKPFSQTSPPAGTTGDYSERSKYERHPRSAVGWSGTHVYLVTVDGRQPGLSDGMKLAELAAFMRSLGCTEAMNLDGGKSAQMWVNGRIVNSPCQGEDTVANSLLVIRKAEGS